jgi:hypothetical protein
MRTSGAEQGESMKGFAIAIAVFAAISGCGSCQPPEEKSTAPGSAASSAEPTKPAPPAQAPPIAPVPDQPAAQAPEEDDCFVVLDAVPDYGPAPLEVQFSAEVDCTSGDPTYAWTFGDGSPVSTEANPKHTYQKPGEYPASVVITGPGGGTDTDELDILVEE